MNPNITLDRDFERCLDEMRSKYGEKFEYINGVHPSQLDYSVFMNRFKEAGTLADVSSDPSANARNLDLRSFLSEKDKPYNKIFGMSKIFYEIKKKWGLKTAKEWYEQEYSKGYYLNDASASSSFYPYCYAVDLSRLAREGLFFLKDYNAQPPKHLTTFLDDVIEFVSFLSNRQSGAVGLPNIIVWMWYFWDKDCKEGYYIKDPEYYFKQSTQKLIYRLNQPFLRIDQSSFTNVSIFDRCYLESLFGGLEFPDGSFGIDHIEDIIAAEKAFMEVVVEIRKESMFTYPVFTYSLLYKDGRFQDEEFARWCSDTNVEWSDSNFFVSDNVGVLSNCCFDGSQMTLSKSTDRINYMSFKDLYNDKSSECKRNFRIFHNGGWVGGKIIRLPAADLIKVKTANNKELILTKNHIQPVLGGDKAAEDITTNDYILFSARQVEAIPERDMGLTYEEGYLIGMYLGDGSCDKISERNGIYLSLNEEKYGKSIDIITKALKQLNISVEVKLGKQYHNVYPIKICSKELKDFIFSWVSGNYCYEKELNLEMLLQSSAFRRGVIDGYYVTDGGNSNRIYTTSKKLVSQMEVLFTSLGIPTIIDESDRTDEPVIIRGQEFERNYPLYCIRWYNMVNKRRFGNIYKIVNNSVYFKVKSIVPYESDDGYVYCFEMADEGEPYFTLPNGVITHNCRLLSDTSKLSGFINSIGGTALSIGSVRVNTINLVRIAYESNLDKEEYLRILKARVILDCKVLYSIRHIIKRNIEKGLLPNYKDGALELDKQYCTIGILGLYEVMDLFGLIREDELGNKYYTNEAIEFASRIFDVINETKDSFTDEFSYNVESIPGENCAGTICAADNLLFDTNKYYIYSNQWIPLREKCTLAEKCKLSAILDNKCSGGAIAHINIEGRFSNRDMAWNMLNYVAQQGVIYFAFNTKISVCEHRHAFIGTEKCPKCGGPVADTFTRVVGFYTPVSGYQEIRRKEFDERKWYTLEDGIIS